MDDGESVDASLTGKGVERTTRYARVFTQCRTRNAGLGRRRRAQQSLLGLSPKAARCRRGWWTTTRALTRRSRGEGVGRGRATRDARVVTQCSSERGVERGRRVVEGASGTASEEGRATTTRSARVVTHGSEEVGEGAARVVTHGSEEVGEGGGAWRRERARRRGERGRRRGGRQRRRGGRWRRRGGRWRRGRER